MSREAEAKRVLDRAEEIYRKNCKYDKETLENIGKVWNAMNFAIANTGKMGEALKNSDDIVN